MRRLLLLVCLALCCAGSRHSPVETPGGRNEAASVVMDFVDAFERLELTRFLDLFADDASVFFPFAERALRADGKALFRDGFAALFEEARKGRTGPRFLKLEPSEVTVRLNGEVALVSFHLLSGAVVSRRTLVLERRDGRFLITHLHASNLRQPDPAAATGSR